jgi:hypothetical protein
MATGVERSGPAPLTSVLAAVRARADLDLAEELDRRLAHPAGPRPVHVTQLLEPRAAYYRLLHPVPVAPAVAERRYRGRLRHEQIERLLAAPEDRELRIVRDGIVGQIDLFRGRPTEVKTTGAVPSAATLGRERPHYVDQLGMYCALTDVTEGRLVVAGPAAGAGPPRVVVVDCRFEGLDAVRRGMGESARSWREALARRDPAGLPACPWFERGCEFRRAGVCSCTGREPEAPDRPSSHLFATLPDEDAARSLAALLPQGDEDGSDTAVHSYRELLYPRRAYYERTEAPDAEAVVAPPAPSDEGSLYRAIQGALEAEPSDGLLRQAAGPPAPEERVVLFRGDPLLLRSTRSRRPPRPEELARSTSAPVLELGLRCAALGRPEGWLVMAHEMLAPDEDPVRVYRLRFDPLTSWTGELAARCERFSTALRERRPEALDACPEWMMAGCPYASRCGEAVAAPSRDHR